MSGRFIPSVRFPLHIEGCKSARLHVEPFLSASGYGIEVKLILTLTGGLNEDKYEYERTIHSEFISQQTVPEGSLYETAYEYFEGFYYNKISQDVVVPVTAAILKTYFPELVENCGINLSDYFLDVKDIPHARAMGFRK